MRKDLKLIIFGVYALSLGGCTKCQNESAALRDPQSVVAPKSPEAATETGDEGEATDAIETPTSPNWESAVEPGIGE